MQTFTWNTVAHSTAYGEHISWIEPDKVPSGFFHRQVFFLFSFLSYGNEQKKTTAHHWNAEWKWVSTFVSIMLIIWKNEREQNRNIHNRLPLRHVKFVFTEAIKTDIVCFHSAYQRIVSSMYNNVYGAIEVIFQKIKQKMHTHTTNQHDVSFNMHESINMKINYYLLAVLGCTMNAYDGKFRVYRYIFGFGKYFTCMFFFNFIYIFYVYDNELLC